MENDFNVHVNLVYLEALKYLEKFTGDTPSEFINNLMEDCIESELEFISTSLPVYLEKTAKRLGVEL